MMSKTGMAALFAASTFVLAGAASPAFAASPMTGAFVANARANVDFLDSASRLALTQSDSASVRSFARHEAREQTIAGNSLVAFSEANPPPVVATGPVIGPDGGLLGPVAGVATLPLDVAANVTTSVGNNVDNVITGRSVAIDNPLAPPMAAAPMPMPADRAATADLDRLRGLHGRDFNVLYRSSQRDALNQLRVLYSDYMQNGDDAALRAMARRELPKINRDLRELDRI